MVSGDHGQKILHVMLLVKVKESGEKSEHVQSHRMEAQSVYEKTRLQLR